MPNLVGRLVSGTNLAKTCEIEGAVGCVLVYLCKYVGSVCQFSMWAVLATFGMWQQYIFSDISQICVQCSLLHDW